MVDTININNIDAIKFFNEKMVCKELPVFLKSRFLRSLGLRILGFLAWRDNFFNLREMTQGIIPGRFQSNSFKNKQYEYIKKTADKIFRENNFYLTNEIKLFNKPFSPAKEEASVDSWLNFFLLFFQIVISDQYHLKDFIKKDSVVIDAGANIGIFSAMAAKLYQQGMIYSFEPGRIAFKALKKNMSFYENVALYNSGLGEISGNARFMTGNNTAANSVLDYEEGIDFATIENVKIDNIDNFVEANNLKRVDFVKIDTEGYEEKVIKGAKETIKKFSPVMAVSAYHKPEDKHLIPLLVLSINPLYKYKLYKDVEDIFLFWK